jgi:hypothetical protein
MVIRKALKLEDGEEALYRSKKQHKAMQSILYDD